MNTQTQAILKWLRDPETNLITLWQKRVGGTRISDAIADAIERDVLPGVIDTTKRLQGHTDALGATVREHCGEPFDGKTHCRDCYRHGCPVYTYLNDNTLDTP